MGRKKTGSNKRLKRRYLGQRQLKKFKNQIPLSKTTTIESNSNPQFVIAAFQLLKKKTLSRITTFAKYTSLGISLAEKLNSSFFFPINTIHHLPNTLGWALMGSCLSSPHRQLRQRPSPHTYSYWKKTSNDLKSMNITFSMFFLEK